MARENLARDSKLDDGGSSSRFAGTTAGTALRPGATVAAATSTGSRRSTVPAGASASAQAPADARSSTDAARIDFADRYRFAFAAEGGHRGV